MKKFFITTIGLLISIALLVILFDPFYVYHEPLPTLKAVLVDRENQCMTSLRTLQYDSILLGSSVAENFNNQWFQEEFGGTLVKGIQASASIADLQYLLSIAFEYQNITRVFYSLDTTSLMADTDHTFERAGVPLYLMNRNFLDDFPYWWNKDILFEKIPYMLIQSWFLDYDEGLSYQWGHWKTFDAIDTLSRYTPIEESKDMKVAEYYKDINELNIALITESIESHPETEFYFFFPPVSLLWWDDVYLRGDTEAYLQVLSTTISRLLSYENVKIYGFQVEEEYVLQLDHYMDNVHFSPEVNKYMVDCMANNQNEITTDTLKVYMEKLQQLTITIQTKEIIKYYER